MLTIVLLLKSLHPHTGNNSTVERIKSYFSSPKFNCVIVGANSFSTAEKFHFFLEMHHVSLVIGIHAHHAGRLLVQSSVPYVIIFGGTDLNEFTNNAVCIAIMTQVVNEAKSLVVFNMALQNKAQQIWPLINVQKFVSIPQAVTVTPSQFNIYHYLRYNNILSCKFFNSDNCILENFKPYFLFTLVAGIRPVKDPLYLISAFSKWHQRNSTCFLLIIGPVIDEEYSKIFERRLAHLAGVFYIPGLHYHDCHAVIRDSFAVVNSSISEGMSTALLEAMALETLVIVRNNPGNLSLVTHRENGLVFTSPSEFILCIQEAFSCESQRNAMIDNAKRLVMSKHNCDVESGSYHELVHKYAKQYC